jgi:hypothetical protein
MKEDPLVAEIRAVRHRISEEFAHDTRALVEHYRQLEMKYGSSGFSVLWVRRAVMRTVACAPFP